MDFHNMSFPEGLLISAFCMLIVVVVLVCISYLVDITAFFTRMKKKRVTEPVLVEETLEEVDDTRTLAIIAAAIASMGGERSGFVVRKVEKKKATLSGWEAESLRNSKRR